MTDQDTADAALPADAPDAAARQATTNVPIAAPADRVEEVLAGLPGHSFDSVAVIAIADAGALVGAVTIERLLAAALLPRSARSWTQSAVVGPAPTRSTSPGRRPTANELGRH